MGTIEQLAKKQSEFVPEPGMTTTTQVWNLQVATVPTTGETFSVTPHRYRMTSAATPGFQDDGYYYVVIGANVSAAYSAISSRLNIASEVNIYGVSGGVD